MDNTTRLEDRLEILIITYNRCRDLEKTLGMLARSPFRECRITVIDNCSHDTTGEVVASCGELFPHLNYLRNRVNIGGNPNYLKAIEFSTSEYTWIVCDDDDLDFSDCNDVIEAVIASEYDIIEVGSIDHGKWPRGVATTPSKLIEQGLSYHFPMGFFPAYIFRTATFDSACFVWGYRHIDYLYPQFGYLNKSVRENFSIYLSRKKIVTRNDVADHSFSPLYWYASWLSCCRSIQDPKLRFREIDYATHERGFFKCMVFWSVMDKYMADGEFLIRVAGILRTMNLWQRLKYLLVLPIVLLPVPFSFWVWVRTTLYHLMKVPDSEVPPLRVVNRGW